MFDDFIPNGCFFFFFRSFVGVLSPMFGDSYAVSNIVD